MPAVQLFLLFASSSSSSSHMPLPRSALRRDRDPSYTLDALCIPSLLLDSPTMPVLLYALRASRR